MKFRSLTKYLYAFLAIACLQHVHADGIEPAFEQSLAAEGIVKIIFFVDIAKRMDITDMFDKLPSGRTPEFIEAMAGLREYASDFRVQLNKSGYNIVLQNEGFLFAPGYKQAFDIFSDSKDVKPPKYSKSPAIPFKNFFDDIAARDEGCDVICILTNNSNLRIDSKAINQLEEKHPQTQEMGIGTEEKVYYFNPVLPKGNKLTFYVLDAGIGSISSGRFNTWHWNSQWNSSDWKSFIEQALSKESGIAIVEKIAKDYYVLTDNELDNFKKVRCEARERSIVIKGLDEIPLGYVLAIG